MEITSVTNQKVKDWVKLQQKKYRNQEGLFLIEGEHLLEEAMKQNIVEIVILRKDSNIQVNFSNIYYVSDEVMKKISTNVSLVDVIAVCHSIEQKEVISDKIIVLDGVQDPGNVGTIIRTAVSFGYQTLYLSEKSVDLYNDKLIRSTQGALFQLMIQQVDIVKKIKELKLDGYKVYVTALQDATELSKTIVEEKAIIVFGSEGQGVSEEVSKLADYKVKIEMDTFESLNVAVAAGIVLYQFSNK